jgi:hypothetical protein
MQSGFDHPTGPSGRDEHDRQAYYDPPPYQASPEALSAQVAPVGRDMTPARREPPPTLAELQQLQEARAFAVRLKVEANNMFDIHTGISRRMQAEPLTGDLDGQTQQAAMRATLARVMMRRIDRLEEDRDQPGYSEQWTTRHDYRQGLSGGS